MPSSLEVIYQVPKFSQHGELECSPKALVLLSCSSHSCFSFIHLFSLVLLTEYLLCARTVLATGNTAMNKTDEVHVLMELTLGKTTVMVLNGAKCCQDIHWKVQGQVQAMREGWPGKAFQRR